MKFDRTLMVDVARVKARDCALPHRGGVNGETGAVEGVKDGGKFGDDLAAVTDA